jgi:protocatechuate 3,4-dioxygenase beta subunit
MHDIPGRYIMVLMIVPCLFLMGALLILWPDFDNFRGIDWLSSPDFLDEEFADGTGELITDLENTGGDFEPDFELFVPDSATLVKPTRISVSPTGIFLSGSVSDLVTGDPVTAFDFRLRRSSEEGKWVDVIHETVKETEGRFSFPMEEEGSYYLEIRSSHHYQKKVKNLEIREGKGISDLHIQLNPGVVITGRVVDKSTGRPVEDALIVPVDPDASRYGTMQLNGELDAILFGFSESATHTRSNAKGEFTLQGLLKKRYNVIAYHSDYMPGIVDCTADSGEIADISLSSGYYVYGRVLDDEGRPLSDAYITLSQNRNILIRSRRSSKGSRYSHSHTSLTALPVKSGPDGRYRTIALKPGIVTMIASFPGRSEENPRAFTPEVKRIELVDQNREVNFGPTTEHVTWLGKLYSSSGVPLPEVELLVSLAPADESEYGPSIHRMAVSSEEAEFEFRKLVAGQCKVYMKLPGMKTRVEWGTFAFDKTGIVRKDLYVKGGVIRGRIVDQWTGRALGGKDYRVHARQTIRSRNLRSFEALVSDEGRFSIEGLPPGNYTVTAQGPKRVSTQIKDLYLDEGQVLDGLSIVIPSRGTLSLKLMDFTGDELKRVKAGARCLYDDKRGSFHIRRSLPNNVRMYSGYLDAGPWTTEISIKNLGSWTWDLQIIPDQVTEIEVYRNYLE